MKTKAGNRLNEWISEAIGSGLKEIGGFAQSMKPDFQAIQNAFNLPWSNGPVEGNVNKIKTLKRQMYGRAGFDLLKRRLLLNSVLPPKVGMNQSATESGDLCTEFFSYNCKTIFKRRNSKNHPFSVSRK